MLGDSSKTSLKQERLLSGNTEVVVCCYLGIENSICKTCKKYLSKLLISYFLVCEEAAGCKWCLVT